VKLNLLDDGVVDTFGSIGATSDVQTSINASDGTRIPRAARQLPLALRSAFQHPFDAQRREIDFSARGPAIWNRQNVIQCTVILWKSLPSRRRPTTRCAGRFSHGVAHARVMHLATVVQIAGESYRLKDKRRAGIMARPNKANDKEESI
jgi:hypothetical protein